MNFETSVILQVVFWISLLAILHTYGIYPILMCWLAGKGKRMEREIYSPCDDGWPDLNVVMAIYNEETVIEATLQSIVDSNYPREKLKVYLGSDNSTDNSHKIIEQFREKYSFVYLKVFHGRNGKIKIINQLVDLIPNKEGAVLLLCDANVVWTNNLAGNLARHFKDKGVGIVASTVIDAKDSKQGIGTEEQAYVSRENRVKFAEGSLLGRMMGAFGACYAMRRSIYEAVPDHFNVDDFYQTMVCYEQGYAGLVDMNAICYESVSEDINEEFRRKKRISKGNFQNLLRFSKYLLPWNCGLGTFFAFWSHKGFRWFGPFFLLGMMISGLTLALNGEWIYSWAISGILGTFFIAGADKLMETLTPGHRISLFKFARYFYAMNLALFLGGIEFCKGVTSSVWEPTKRVHSRNVTKFSNK